MLEYLLSGFPILVPCILVPWSQSIIDDATATAAANCHLSVGASMEQVSKFLIISCFKCRFLRFRTAYIHSLEVLFLGAPPILGCCWLQMEVLSLMLPVVNWLVGWWTVINGVRVQRSVQLTAQGRKCRCCGGSRTIVVPRNQPTGRPTDRRGTGPADS